MQKFVFIFLLATIAAGPDVWSQSGQAGITKWVNQHCIPLTGVTAQGGLEDLRPLDSLIGDARIVELGECTHGSSEIFSMKHRLLEYLVKEKGFTIFSIEANMPEAYALNQYIIKGTGNPRSLLAGMYFWTWNTQEVLRMIEWMKSYNDTAKKKIIFTGFDMQFPRTSVGIVSRFAAVRQPGLLPAVHEYDSLYRQERASLTRSEGKKLGSLAGDIMEGIEKIQGPPGDTARSWALQNAGILWQYAANAAKKQGRDESMAENVQWILERNPGAKMVIWAHNDHVRKARKFGIPMGYYLDRMYGNALIAIGFSTGEGTYTATGKVDGRYTGVDSGHVLLPPGPKDIEYYFGKADAGDFIIDLRRARRDPAAGTWIRQKIRMRDIGALADDTYQFTELNPDKDFDMILFLKKTSSSRCFYIRKGTGADK